MATHHPPEDATSRFSDRVADYVRYRPGYPGGVLSVLRDRCGLQSGAQVADIGSGTGIFSRLLLDEGAEVFAVEPNADMRKAAEAMLGHDPLFRSIAASGEETSLADRSMDLIVAAQAFHWLDRTRARKEFTRLLKPGGRIALIWNVRQTASTPFLRDYEDLLLNVAPDYALVRHENVDAEVLMQFFRDGVFEKHVFAHQQSFDFAGLCGRLRSSSYTPAQGHPLHEPMVRELQRLFEVHQQGGTVALLYDTEVFIGS